MQSQLRHWMNLSEAVLHEIEIGGEVDPSSLEQLRSQDFKSKQLDLFPDIPTLEPDLPREFEEMGRIGPYYIARKIESQTTKHGPEYIYYLFDQGTPFGYVAVIHPNAEFGGGYTKSWHNPQIDGNGLRVVSIWVDRTHAGQNLGVKLYHWLLQNVCDYILPDDLQTQGGVAIWRKLLNSRAFDVMVYDYNTGTYRRRWAGKDFNQVYKTYNLRPFVTLRGKAETLIDNG